MTKTLTCHCGPDPLLSGDAFSFALQGIDLLDEFAKC